jgi:peptidoglycan/LPS O-acetylase OafA/YrhL
VGGVLLTLLQFWVLRRTRAGAPGGWPAELATVLPWIVLGGLVAAIVLMAGKPVG